MRFWGRAATHPYLPGPFRRFQKIAGPDLPAINLLVDCELARRLAQQAAALEVLLQKLKRHQAKVERRQAKAARPDASPSPYWTPSDTGNGMPDDLPQFLTRLPAAPRPAAASEAELAPEPGPELKVAEKEKTMLDLPLDRRPKRPTALFVGGHP